MRKLIKKALWPVLPKPWEAADMEFHFGLWNGVSALYSESGRQLGEENTRPFVLNHNVPAETIFCKYNDSREGRQINMSALRIAMQNFDNALAITGAVRHFHLSRLKNAGPIGIWDLYILARASIALIAYQKRCKHQQAVQPTVSDSLTSQYQFISGVYMICRHMLESGDQAIARNGPISAEALYAYADKHNIFISFNGMACAGSIKKINEFLEFCNNGNGPISRPVFDLSDIVNQPGNWYQYALATIELDCFIEYERAQVRARQSNLEKIANSNSAQNYTNLGDYVSGLMKHSFRAEKVPFRTGALIRQNAILELIGRTPIDRIQDKHVLTRLR